jgi:hypothetical protein
MKRFFVTVCISIAAFSMNGGAFAQDDAGSDELLSVSVDVASGFVWRGIANNMFPVIQPSITFSPGKFSIGTWASTPFSSGEYQELDIFVGYSITSSISIGVTDYFIYDDTDYSYFERLQTGGHAFDLQLSYDGSGGFPVKAMVSAIIAGNDLNDKAENNYSTYIELGYGNKCRGVDWEVCAGIVPMKSGFYGVKDFNMVNLGLGVSKSFEITPTYSLPLALNFTVNPSAKTAYLVATVTLF